MVFGLVISFGLVFLYGVNVFMIFLNIVLIMFHCLRIRVWAFLLVIITNLIGRRFANLKRPSNLPLHFYNPCFNCLLQLSAAIKFSLKVLKMCNSPWSKLINKMPQELPCGQCLGCRQDSLALWTARCNSEYVKGYSAFVTFTYDDLHLPYNDNALLPTVRNMALHRYLDNIRHKVNKANIFPEGCRKDFSFLACSDYGGKFARPHYHVLFFGLDFKIHEPFFISSWKNGSVKSLPILQGGIRYVCNYVAEKENGEMAEVEYDDTLRERPRLFVSKGLGSDLFFAHAQEIIETGCIHLGSRLVPCPSYYKNLVNPFAESFSSVRDKRMYQNYHKSLMLAKSLGFPDYDSYIRYARRSRELSLAQQYRLSGKRCLPQYNNCESIKEGYIPTFIKVRLQNGFSNEFVSCS